MNVVLSLARFTQPEAIGMLCNKEKKQDYYDKIRYIFTQNQRRNHNKLKILTQIENFNSTNITKSRNATIFIDNCLLLH